VEVTINDNEVIFKLVKTSIVLTKMENWILSLGTDKTVWKDENNTLYTSAEVETIKELLSQVNMDKVISL